MATEVISPWTIYWIMQLDSINGFLSFATIGLSLYAGGSLFIGGLVTDRGCYPSDEQDQQWAGLKKYAFRAVLVAAIAGALGAFIPSSRTAAAVILIPAIANNETVQKEAGELYELAKQGLRELVKPEEKK